MVEVTKDYLDEIFADVDAREAVDVVPGSCDEESDSDLDVPKALPPSPVKQVTQRQWSAPGLSARPRAPLTPTAVQATAGRAGRPSYLVTKPSSDAHYFMVQW